MRAIQHSMKDLAVDLETSMKVWLGPKRIDKIRRTNLGSMAILILERERVFEGSRYIGFRKRISMRMVQAFKLSVLFYI